MTIGGPILLERTVLRVKDNSNFNKLNQLYDRNLIVPLDEALGLDKIPFKATPGAMLVIADWVQRSSSYEAAEMGLKKYTDIVVNDDTMRQIANTIGSIIFDIDEKKADKSIKDFYNHRLDFPKNKNGILYLKVDDAMVQTREKDASGSKWRENKLGLAFSTDNIMYWASKNGQKEHSIKKREYRTLLGDASDFKKHFFSLALDNGYGKYEQTVLISDGATWIRDMKDELFADAQQILDYYHLCENIIKYAKTIFKNDEVKYKPWAKSICEAMIESKYIEVLTELKTLDKKKYKNNDFNLYNYISNNINNIDYAEYKRKGYFIGSGAIESGNKIGLQQRLKQAGMRWNVKTAQNILTLMSKAKSDLWDAQVVEPILRYYSTDAFV
jgi:hypothetical protein